jgi:hypothetical protein
MSGGGGCGTGVALVDIGKLVERSGKPATFNQLTKIFSGGQ